MFIGLVELAVTLDASYWCLWTFPPVFVNEKVPEVLLSGHHQNIKDWFLKKRIEKTKNIRKDLLKKYKSKNNGE